MLILTYHKVQPSDARMSGDFYSVDEAQLGAHLDVLAARGYRAGSSDDLCAGSADQRAFFLTFDDGTRDHYEVVHPFLRARGLRGVFFIPTEKIDRPGYVTATQVRELALAGHEIGCHSHAHRRLDLMSETEIHAQLSESIERLAALTGAAPRLFAPPGGYTDARVRRIAAGLGLRAQRTMEWGLNQPPRLDSLQCLPLNRRFSAERLGKILDGLGLGWLKSLYVGKQLLKSLLPLRAYTQLREQLLRPPHSP
jgi:peptidoglycan/xylan/chitin deacetylase (PgdA/CDA1 family)